MKHRQVEPFVMILMFQRYYIPLTLKIKNSVFPYRYDALRKVHQYRRPVLLSIRDFSGGDM